MKINNFFCLIFLFYGCQTKNVGLHLVFEESVLRPHEMLHTKNFYIYDGQVKADVDIKAGKSTNFAMTFYYHMAKDKVVIAVHPMRKLVINPDMSQFSALAANPLEKAIKTKSTGNFKTVSGIKCEELIGEHDSKIYFKSCLAKFVDLEVDTKSGNAFMGLAKKLALGLGQDFSNVDGMIIENQSFDEKGNIMIHSKLKSIGKTELSTTLYNTPKGYEVFKMQAIKIDEIQKLIK